MKFTGLLFVLLYLQASASFLDEFRGAMSNVERGFGKLLTDVVTDVKDTIHCTISAVEQVLVLNGLLDKTSAYHYRCRDLSKPVQPPPPKNNRDQRSLFDSFNRLKYPNRNLYQRNSPRHLSTEIGKSIANVGKTIDEILGNRKVTGNLRRVSETLKNETNRLADISKILKRELENISSNIRIEMNKLNFDRKEVNVESIWDEIKTLHDIQTNSKNTTEINAIRSILDKVVDKLYFKPDDHKVSGRYNLEDIKKKLQNYSHNNDRRVLKDNQSAHTRSQELSLQKSKEENASKPFKDVAHKDIFRHQVKNTNTNSSNTQNSLFNLDLDSLNYFTPFTNTGTNNKEAVNDAKKIIEDSQRTDKVIRKLFKGHPGGFDMFSNPELFNFG